jgi:hypothetical protein
MEPMAATLTIRRPDGLTRGQHDALTRVAEALPDSWTIEARSSVVSDERRVTVMVHGPGFVSMAPFRADSAPEAFRDWVLEVRDALA